MSSDLSHLALCSVQQNFIDDYAKNWNEMPLLIHVAADFYMYEINKQQEISQLAELVTSAITQANSYWLKSLSNNLIRFTS